MGLGLGIVLVAAGAILAWAAHYAAVAGVVGVLLWLAVPRALTEVQAAVSALPDAKSQVKQEARQSGSQARRA